ncbi:MAG: nusG [Modestobacter sp.]|nr:nusG [Modestobacter sp.]
MTDPRESFETDSSVEAATATDLDDARFDERGAADIETGVGEIGAAEGSSDTAGLAAGALDGAVGLEGLTGVGHRVSSFSGVVQARGGQPKTASTPWAKAMSRPATSATMTATKTITTVV